MEYFSQFPITSALIAANIVASLIAFVVPDFFEQNVFRIAPILKKGELHRVVTSAFLHVNVLHLFVNMFVLYMFGPVLEHALGAVGYLLVYFAALVGASLWMLADKRNTPDYSAVGASGAISGIVLAFCMFQPFQMLPLFFLLPIPAVVFGIGYIILSYWLSRRESTMVAHGAHLGGALAGVAATILVYPDVIAIFMRQLSGAV